MEHGLTSYDKYSVKTGRDGKLVFKQDGSPELDEKLSTGVMLDEITVKQLNRNVKDYGFFFVNYESKKEPEVKKEPEIKVVATIELAQPIDGESLKKDLTLDKLKAFTEEELNAVLPLMSKAAMLDIVGIEMTKPKLQLTNAQTCIGMVKEKLNELKSN